jgi:hypothetical protein
MVVGRCKKRGSYKVVRIEQSAEKDYRTSCPSSTDVYDVQANGDYYFVCLRKN